MGGNAMKKLLAIFLSILAVCSSEGIVFAQTSQNDTVSSGNGIIINEDGHNTLCGPIGYNKTYDVTDKQQVMEGLKQTMHNYAGTQVSDVVIAANFQYSFAKSEVMEDVYDKWNATTTWTEVSNGQEIDLSGTLVEIFYKVIYEHDIDIYREWFTQLEKDNINGWLSIRMNDFHDYGKINGERNSLYNYTAYKKGRTIGSYHSQDPAGNYACLDYGNEDVYGRYKNYIAEQLNNYGDIIDGIELDFLRESYCFAPGEEAEGREIMTNLLAEVNKAVKEVETDNNCDIKISVRLPRELEQAYDSGFDAVTWAKQGLIDTITVSTRWETCDTDMPISQWVKVFDKYNVKINAGSEILYRSSGYDNGYRMTNLENDYALAMQYLSEGADKVYYFNHYSSWNEGYNQPFDESDVCDIGTRRDLLENAGSIETLLEQNRSHIVSYQDITGNLYDNAYRYRPLPITLTEGKEQMLRIKTGQIADSAKTAVIVGFSTTTQASDFELYCNGEVIPFTEQAYCYGVDEWNEQNYRLGQNLGVSRAFVYELPSENVYNDEQVLTFRNISASDITVNYAEVRVMPDKNTDNYIYLPCTDYDRAAGNGIGYQQYSDGMTSKSGAIRYIGKLWTGSQYNCYEWMRYTVNSLSDGLYKVYICYQLPNTETYEVLVSGGKNEEITTTLARGGYDSGRFYKSELCDFMLFEGENNMTIKALTDGTIYIDYLEFVRVGDIPPEMLGEEVVTLTARNLNTDRCTNYSAGTNTALFNNGYLEFDFDTKLSGTYSLASYFNKNDGQTIRFTVDGKIYASTVTLTEEADASNSSYKKADFGTVELGEGAHTLGLYANNGGSNTLSKIVLTRVGENENGHISFNAYNDQIAKNFALSTTFDKFEPKIVNAQITANASSSYSITADRAGYYVLSMTYGLAHGTEGEISAELELAAGDKAYSFNLTSNCSAISNTTLYYINGLTVVYLEKGANTLTLTNKSSNAMRVEAIMLDYITPTEVNVFSYDENNSSYNTVASSTTWLNTNSNEYLTYNLTMEAGTYKLILTVANGDGSWARDNGYNVYIGGLEQVSNKCLTYSGAWDRGIDYEAATVTLTGSDTLKLVNYGQCNLMGIKLLKIK